MQTLASLYLLCGVGLSEPRGGWYLGSGTRVVEHTDLLLLQVENVPPKPFLWLAFADVNNSSSH